MKEVEAIEQAIRTIFKSTGEIKPQLILEKHKMSSVFLFDPSLTKDQLFLAMNEIVEKMQPDAHFFCSEVYMVKSEGEIECAPSEHPDKIEAVLIFGRVKGKDCLSYAPILREGEQATLGEFESIEPVDIWHRGMQPRTIH